MARRLLVLMLLGLGAIARASPPVPGPIVDPRARAHMQAGLELYAAGHYAEAIDRFRQGFSIEPREEFLYALGQATRRSGDCAAAIEYYDAFVRTTRDPDQAAAARLQIERCRQELAARPRPPPERSAPAPKRVRTWRRDWLGHALAAGGVIAAGTGAIVAWRARATIGDAGDDYDAFGRASGAVDREHIGDAVLIGGLALVAVGVAHYVWWDGTSVEVAAASTSGGAAVSLTLRR